LKRLFSPTARRATGDVTASAVGASVSVFTIVRVATSITELLKFDTNAYWPSKESSMSPTEPVKSVAGVAPVERFTNTVLFEITAIAWLLSGVIRTISLVKSFAVTKLPDTVRVARSIFVSTFVPNSCVTTARRPSALTSTPSGFAATARSATWVPSTRS
jgi:hypothetical protein